MYYCLKWWYQGYESEILSTLVVVNGNESLLTLVIPGNCLISVYELFMKKYDDIDSA